MTRKDYVMLSAALHKKVQWGARNGVELTFGDALDALVNGMKEDNTRFDMNMFCHTVYYGEKEMNKMKSNTN